jgi:hypothetical protein
MVDFSHRTVSLQDGIYTQRLKAGHPTPFQAPGRSMMWELAKEVPPHQAQPLLVLGGVESTTTKKDVFNKFG